MKTFFYGELDTYVIPGFNNVVTLGGSRNFDSVNTKICPFESAAIRQRCESLLPVLKKAKVVREEVGLRPHRENNVRVEVEQIVNGFSTAIVSFRGIVYFHEFLFHNHWQIIFYYSWCIITGTEVTECAPLLELRSMPSNWRKKCINPPLQNYKWRNVVLALS